MQASPMIAGDNRAGGRVHGEQVAETQSPSRRQVGTQVAVMAGIPQNRQMRGGVPPE